MKKSAVVLKNRVREARLKLNISQEELAQKVGVSRVTVSSLETGKFCPTAKLALVLCIVLNEKFENLFYFEKE